MIMAVVLAVVAGQLPANDQDLDEMGFAGNEVQSRRAAAIVGSPCKRLERTLCYGVLVLKPEWLKNNATCCSRR